MANFNRDDLDTAKVEINGVYSLQATLRVFKHSLGKLPSLIVLNCE